MSFFDMFGPMFDPGSGPNRPQGQRASKSGNDDPIILNVETDGDDTARFLVWRSSSPTSCGMRSLASRA